MKNAKQLQFTPSYQDISFENQVRLSTNASFISAKEYSLNFIFANKVFSRSFADSMSPQSLVQCQFTEPKEDLWQSILKLRSMSSKSMSPKFVDTMPVEMLPDDDMSSTSKFRSSAYVQWRKLILIVKCVRIFKKSGIERITSEVNC